MGQTYCCYYNYPSARSFLEVVGVVRARSAPYTKEVTRPVAVGASANDDSADNKCSEEDGEEQGDGIF